MTITAPEPVVADLQEDVARVDARVSTESPPPGDTPVGQSQSDDAGEREVHVPLVALAALLSSASAAWLAAGLINGFLPRIIALAGVATGVGVTFISYRSRRPAAVQYAVLPIAALLGAVVISPVADGGTANLPGLAAEALQGGGLLQAPIPFDPGWRFILVVLFAVLGSASLAMAVGRARPNIAVGLPLPMIFGSALLQPEGTELVASTVAIFLVVGAIAAAYGASLAGDAEMRRSFELRRLGQGLAMLVLLMGGMVALAQNDFLFPVDNKDKVIPPQKPPQVPLEKDRELFRVASDRPGPWRVGVLDVYDGEGWLLPPFDTDRLVRLADGRQPGGPTADTTEVEFHLVDMRGRSLPVPAGLVAVTGVSDIVDLDPRTEVPQLEQRVPRGLRYAAVVTTPPTAAQMNSAPPAPESMLAEFGSLPPPPAALVPLLAEAPPGAFSRIQFLRDKLYESVVAAGAGSPVDISITRVVEMLTPGTEATPFEITAAEAMLARWAGVPARIGYGYHRGDQIDGGSSLRPKHGAAWLEAYFEGHGWVPLVGTPPQAKSSVSEDQQNENSAIQPSEEVALTVFVPVQRMTAKMLFELVRYWIVTLLPLFVAGAAVVVSHPALFKILRSRRRRRWGYRNGPAGQVLVAYAELRDRCHDLNIGTAQSTPLQFVSTFTYDEEHDEVAWLVTRMLWGDLRRDLRDDDVKAAERMLGSVRNRIVREQTAVNRLLASISRASLRDPWSSQIPNLWPQLHLRARLRRTASALMRPLRWPLVVIRRRPSIATMSVLMLLLGGCATQGGFDGAKVPTAYPEPMVPDPPATIAGFRFERELSAEAAYEIKDAKALVSEGRVYTIQDSADSIQGSLQVGLLLPELDGSSPQVQRQIEQSIGGEFQDYRIATAKLRMRVMPELRLFLWFPPERNVMVLWALRNEFEAGPELVARTLLYQRGIDPGLLDWPEDPGTETEESTEQTERTEQTEQTEATVPIPGSMIDDDRKD